MRPPNGATHGRAADRSPDERRWLGAAGLKKLELAKALATGPKLFARRRKSWRIDDTEMDQAADMLRKIRDNSASRSSGSSTSWAC